MSGLDVVLQQVVNGLALGMMYALLALGFTMVYGIIELINFSHFSVFMTGTFVGLTVLDLMGVTAVSRSLSGLPLVATLIALFLVTMLVTGLLGVLIERVCLRPLRNVSGTAPMITTIGVAFILINLMLLTFGPQAQRFPSLLPNWRWPLMGTAEITFKQLVLFAVGLVLMVALSHLVKRTTLGKAMRAVSFHRDAASLMGIPTDRIITITFALGSALAAAAGFLVGLTNPKIEPLMGIMPGIKAFVAAVLGGIGSIPGAMIGGLLMGISEYMVVGYISSTYRDAIAFVILIIVLLIKPAGLLGRNVAEKV